MRNRIGRAFAIAFVLIFVGSLMVPLVADAKNSNEQGVSSSRPGEILVKFKQEANSQYIQTLNLRLGGRSVQRIDRLRVYRIKLPDGSDSWQKIREYQNDPRVEYAEPNYKRSALLTPNDTYYASYQWNMPNAKAPEAWDIETGSNAVVIAIVDSGVSLNHPDLDGKLVAGRDYYGDPPLWLPDDDPSDENGHGTYVAGIAAAETNNGQGVAGVSWGSRIMPVRVLGPSGEGFDSDIANGIIWAADNGAKIINMSFGGPDSSQTVLDAVNYAYNRGCVLIAASGNSGTSQPFYPAAYNHVIAVGATNSSDQRASFSNYGSSLDVTAPGENIFSTFWYNGSNTYGSGSGTSAASPHVAGLAALLASHYPGWTNDQIEQKVELSADDLGAAGRDDYYGYGRINSVRALASQRLSGTLIADSSTGKVYLLEEGQRRWIASPASLSSHGFRWDRIIAVSSYEIATYYYAEGQLLKARPGTLIKGSGPKVYVTDLVGGVYQRRWITSSNVFTVLGYRWEDLRYVSDSELDMYTTGSDVDSAPLYLNGTLIADSSTGKVYLLEEGQKRWITSPATFSSHGLRWDRIITIPAYQIAAYPEGQLLKARPGTLIKGSDSKIYVTDLVGGVYQRRWITSGSIFLSLGYHWEDIFAISDSELFSYTEGPNISL